MLWNDHSSRDIVNHFKDFIGSHLLRDTPFIKVSNIWIFVQQLFKILIFWSDLCIAGLALQTSRAIQLMNRLGECPNRLHECFEARPSVCHHCHFFQQLIITSHAYNLIQTLLLPKKSSFWSGPEYYWSILLIRPNVGHSKTTGAVISWCLE